MAISLKHNKVSDKADGQDDSLLQPSHWNAEHKFIVPAKKLVGNSDDAEAPAEDISVGLGLELVDGALQFGGDDAQVLVAVADTVFPGARAVTDTTTVTWDKPDAPDQNKIKANVPDNAITLAKLEHGTEAQILYYGTDGSPIRLAPGVKGSVLVSGIASAVGPPVVAFTAPSWGFAGAPHAVLRDKKGNGVQGGGFTNGEWRDRVLNNEQYDTYDFVTLASNKFKLVAGTYVVEWSAPAFSVTQHQSRLWNDTDSLILESGTAEVSGTTQNRSLGIAKFTIAAGKDLIIQHRCDITKATDGFGSAANYNDMSEIYTLVKIWRVA